MLLANIVSDLQEVQLFFVLFLWILPLSALKYSSRECHTTTKVSDCFGHKYFFENQNKKYKTLFGAQFFGLRLGLTQGQWPYPADPLIPKFMKTFLLEPPSEETMIFETLKRNIPFLESTHLKDCQNLENGNFSEIFKFPHLENEKWKEVMVSAQVH